MGKPILCLDFDGVIHSYTSGWKGASFIPDPPVPGALAFIAEALKAFDVCVLSSRSHQWGGKRAMKKYLRNEYEALGHADAILQPWWGEIVNDMGAAAMEPWYIANRDAAAAIVRQIKWPWFKPAAMVTIDDRAITFNGEWPDVSELKRFKPWNK